MTVMKALIVDDEYPARKELRYLLDGFPSVEVVGEATNAQEALKLIGAIDYTVIFLDIQMPGMNGLELGQRLREKSSRPYVIFVTAHEDYALKAFEVEAVDYLLKPIDEKRLGHALHKVARMANKHDTKETDPKPKAAATWDLPPRIDLLPVEKLGKTLLIGMDDIVFIYAENEQVYVRTHKENLLVHYRLKELEERLDPNRFFRTHRRFIVNMTKVHEIIPFFNGTYNLIVNDERQTEVPVSRNQSRRLRELLGI